MTIRELLEKRANVYEQQKDIYAQAQAENRPMNEDENSRWDAFEKDYTTLSTQIEEAEAMAKKEAEEARMKGLDLDKETRRKVSDDPKEREEQRKQSFYRWAIGEATRDDHSLLRSYESRYQAFNYGDDLEDRAQGTTVGAGGYLIPEGFSNQLEIQRALFGGMRQASRVWQTAKGDQIPYPTVDDTSNEAQSVAEAGSLTSGTTDVVFSEKVFNAYKLSSDMLKVNNELLQDSYFNFEQILTELLGERIGRKENGWFTTGTGSSQPNGVVTAANQAKRIASTSDVTRSELLDLMHSVDPYYRGSPSCYWMFNDTTLSVIKKKTVGTSDDRPLWVQSMREGEPSTIEGKPYIINQSVANLAASGKFILFGDFSKFIIRDAGMPRLVVARERFIDNDQTAYAILTRVDSELLVNSAIKYLIGATS